MTTPSADMRHSLDAALALHRAGRLDDAEVIYRRVISADPASVEALYLLGQLLRSVGRLDEAIGLFGKAIAIAPLLADPHIQLGHALRECGQLDEAGAAYLRAGASDEAAAGLAAIARTQQGLTALRATMDQQYRQRHWSYLGGVGEAARYGIVAGYVRAAGMAGPLLDLGCGAGVLYGHLPHDLVTGYVGVDLSAEALRGHPAAGVEGAQLTCSPLQHFEPAAGMAFATIVFNEVLYYVDDPMAALRRFRSWLVPGGAFIVSWHCMPDPAETRREDGFWAAVHGPEFRLGDMSVLTNAPRGLSWRVGVICPV